MLPRHATVITTQTPQVLWCQTDRWTPAMRVRALQRMDSLRTRPIWHTQPGWTRRVVHVPTRPA